MSCDNNRDRYFKFIAMHHDGLGRAFGVAGAAIAPLHLIYDVARQQEPPSDPAEQARVKAAAERLFARAASNGYKLHPHPKGPKPEVLYAWSVIAETLEAAEGRGSFPRLALDVQESMAFQAVCREMAAAATWKLKLSPAKRTGLRYAFAERPDILAGLVREPASFDEAEGGPWLVNVSQSLAATLNPQVAAAARHYLALHEAEMLTGDEQIRWALALAGFAQLGIFRVGTPPNYRATSWCPQCGRLTYEHIGGHCVPGDAEQAVEVAGAVARVLADPAYGEMQGLGGPFATMEMLLLPVMCAEVEQPPAGTLGELLEVARHVDARMAVYLVGEAEVGNDEVLDDERVAHHLRNATLRTPVMFDGQPLVWEHGELYPAEAYRAKLQRQILEYELHGKDWRGRQGGRKAGLQPVGTLAVKHLALLMAGKPLPPALSSFAWPVPPASPVPEVRDVLRP